MSYLYLNDLVLIGNNMTKCSLLNSNNLGNQNIILKNLCIIRSNQSNKIVPNNFYFNNNSYYWNFEIRIMSF